MRGAVIYNGEKLLIDPSSFTTAQRPKAPFAISLAHATDLGFPNVSGGIVNGSVTVQGSVHLGATVNLAAGTFIFLDERGWAIG